LAYDAGGGPQRTIRNADLGNLRKLFCLEPVSLHAQFALAQSIDFRSVTDSLDKRRQENPASKPI
jgi:hypothetical protein